MNKKKRFILFHLWCYEIIINDQQIRTTFYFLEAVLSYVDLSRMDLSRFTMRVESYTVPAFPVLEISMMSYSFKTLCELKYRITFIFGPRSGRMLCKNSACSPVVITRSVSSSSL